MKTSSVSPVVTIAIAAAVTVNVAQARTPYDGSWTVQIMTQRGACDPSSSFGVEIHDGEFASFDASGPVGIISKPNSQAITMGPIGPQKPFMNDYPAENALVTFR